MRQAADFGRLIYTNRSPKSSISCRRYLSYATLDVQNETEAQVVWEKMVVAEDSAEKQRLIRHLLAYCELDTLAMVRMHEVLLAL